MRHSIRKALALSFVVAVALTAFVSSGSAATTPHASKAWAVKAWSNPANIRSWSNPTNIRSWSLKPLGKSW